MIVRTIAVTALLVAACLPSTAQRRQEPLTDKEVETIREEAMEPARRVAAFQKIIDDRIDRIRELTGKKYEAGKVDDLHDWFQQVADIAGELEENLETYQKDHADLRKILPKLSEAAQRWKSVLNQPEPNDRYDLVRKFAVDSVDDVQQTADDLLPEQIKYFKEHPPNKNKQDGIVVER